MSEHISIRRLASPDAALYRAIRLEALRRSPETFASTLELVNFIATEVHKGFGPLWNPAATPEARAATVDTLGKKFDVLEKQLGDGPWLTGEAFTIADAYAYAVLNWTRIHKIDLAKWPGLQSFLDRAAQRPGVHKALQEEGLA